MYCAAQRESEMFTRSTTQYLEYRASSSSFTSTASQAAANILAVLHRDNTDQTPQHIIARHHRELTLKPQRQARTVTDLLYGSRDVSQQECAAEGSWQAEPLHNHSIRSNNGPWLYS